MTDFPNGWAETSIGDLGKWGSGGTPKSDNKSFYGGEIPWVRSGDLPDGPIVDHEINITPEGLANSSAKWVPEDAVLIAMYGATIGKLGITTYPVTTNQAVAFCQPNEAISSKFLFLGLGNIKQDLIEMGQGGAQPNISQQILKAVPFPLPPLPEQKRIVAKVDGLTARTARARTDLARIPTLIARYKQRIIALALSGGLTVDWRQPLGSDNWLKQGLRQLSERRATYEKSKRGSRLRAAPPLETGGAADLPNSWISCCVADVADLRVGYAFKSQWFSSTGARLVRGANVAPGRIDWSDERRLSPEHVSSYADYRLETGDVVIAMDRPLISTGLKIAIVQEEDAGSLLVQRVANPRPTAWLHPLFMFYVFNGQGFISQIESHATGSDLPHISGNDILTTRVPLPPIDEQVEIVRRIESAFNWLDRMAADHAAASKLLPKLDAAILAKAFRGELVPQDSKDEPAWVLLERMKGENFYTEVKKSSKSNRARSQTRGKKAAAPMIKNRNDKDVKDQPYLTSILKARPGAATPEELFSLSGLLLHEFYHQLAQEYDSGWLQEADGKVKAI
jgi:type I restriction enzyme S subunit